MIRSHRIALIIAGVFGLCLGCNEADVTGDTENILDLANVDNVAVRVLPSRVDVVVSGELEDSCTEIFDVQVTRVATDIDIAIMTIRPADLACAQVLAPFDEVIELDRAELPPGRYQVDVNGVRETFTVV